MNIVYGCEKRSEGNWNIESDEDAICLVKAVLKDVGGQEKASIKEMSDVKKQLLNMECNCCNGLSTDETEMNKCHERIAAIDAALRKRAEKRHYFEALLVRCENKQWDDEPE